MSRAYRKQINLVMVLVAISFVFFSYYYYKKNLHQEPNRKELFIATCVNLLELDKQSCQDFMNNHANFIDR